ncbi:MAG: apolipoprotein D and lipocalin family protein [Algoriphagus sp.]|jgi:apolipoprotein D and lipocalin family protein
MNPKKIFSYSLPILTGVGILLWANSAKAQDLKTVPNVDLDRYAGKWFEIASFPNPFKKVVDVQLQPIPLLIEATSKS